MIRSTLDGESRGNLLLGLTIFILTIVRIFAAFNLQIDQDESQHLHAAYRIFIGDTLYMDFYEHHGHLFYYMIEPAFRWLHKSFESYFIMRLVLLPFSLASLLLVYHIGRQFLSRRQGLLAVLLLVLMDVFYLKTLEVRPDSGFLFLLLLSIWLILKYKTKPRPLLLLLAGGSLGIAFGFSLKVFYGITALAVVLPVSFRHAGYTWKHIFQMAGVLAAGFLIATAAGLIPLILRDNLQAAADSIIHHAVRFPDPEKCSFIDFRNFVFWILAAGGLWMFYRTKISNASQKEQAGLIFLSGIILVYLLILYVPAPAVYLQSGLPPIALMAVPAGYFMSLIPAFRNTVLRIILLVFLVFYLGVNTGKLVTGLYRDENRVRKKRFQDVEMIAQPHDRILSFNPNYIFYRSALYYPSLVKGIRNKMKGPEYPEDWLTRELRSSGCRIAVPWVDIPDKFSSVIEEYFIPHPELADSTVYVSGTSAKYLAPADTLAFHLLNGGNYQLLFSGADRVQVNDNSCSSGSEFRLPPGDHFITTGKPVSDLLLFYENPFNPSVLFTDIKR